MRKLSDQKWRISNLYWIKDKYGNKIKFKPNWAQLELLDNAHPCQVILKARQLGITTFYCILLLDQTLWNDFIHCGIIAHTLDDAQSIFVDKLKFSFDHLHPAIRALFKTIGDSAKELRFAHGSSIRVGTSLRSSTINYLHISEMGKIVAKYPEKAREVISGALQTLAPGQHCYIESTAEGNQGFFHDLCMDSMRKKQKGEELGLLDYNFFFFPWYREPQYVLEYNAKDQKLLDEKQDYFEKVEAETGITLTTEQKCWYVKKAHILSEDMTREYPSTPHEAFQSSQVGNWYAKQVEELWESGRVKDMTYDRSLPVHTAFDLGQGDATAIWFFQIGKTGDIYIIDYFEKTDFPLDQLVNMLNSKGYTYGTHIWPFDANHRDKAGITFVQQAREYNLFGRVLDQHRILDGINLVRTKMSKMWFDRTKCKVGLNALAKYQKKWNNQIAGYSSEPLHNEYSHGADALRYLCAGLDFIDGTEEQEDDYEAVRAYFGG